MLSASGPEIYNFYCSDFKLCDKKKLCFSFELSKITGRYNANAGGSLKDDLQYNLGSISR